MNIAAPTSYYFWKWADNDLSGEPADAIRIFQDFVRGKPRPAHYHWLSINDLLK